LEWVYSKDAAQGAVKACHIEKLKSRVYDGQEVADIVKRLIPKARVNIIDPQKGVGPSPKEAKEPLDLTRSRSELGYEPEYKMVEAIQDHIKFLKTN
jgi:nucleoside-diphosphate-sugar epimerase